MYFDPNIDNPGPGEYKLNFKHVLPANPKYTMGLNTAIWFDYNKPGVGSYDLRKDGNSNPKFTMAKHLKPIITTYVPGPGTYSPNLKHTNIHVPKYTIQGPTKYNPYNQIPGVGTYNLARDLDGLAFTMGKRLISKASTTPGPGHYSPDCLSSAPAYSIGQHIFDNPFNTPGVGTYNLGKDGNIAPAYSMDQRFIRLRDKVKENKDKRYSPAVKQRPPHRSAAGNTPTSGLVGAQAWTRAASPPLMLAAPSTKQALNWTRPSTWDITAPLVLKPQPRPLTSTQNILRRIHFKLGPTLDPHFNEYIREMYRYMGNKGVRYGHVAKWGTAKSFIHQTFRNKSFIASRER